MTPPSRDLSARSRDSHYSGDAVEVDLLNFGTATAIGIVRRPNAAIGFLVVASRWVVERTFAWFE